jgi:Rod binding domain-containing protein
MNETLTSLPRTTIADLTLGRSASVAGPGWGRPNIRTDNAGAEGLRQAAEEFEAMFLDYFLQQARKSQLADGLMRSSAGETFQGMLDQEYARTASGGLSLGIADALYAQLARHLSKVDE